MLEKDYRFVLSNHPGSTVASYNGATVTGILDETQEKIFTEDNTYFNLKIATFSYITSDLDLNLKYCKSVTIAGHTYTIKESFRENKFITQLTLA